MRTALVAFLLVLTSLPGAAQSVSVNAIPTGARVFIAPIDDGFNEYLKAAIAKKNVPLTLVEDKAQAQFEISGHSESQKASAAKKAILLDWHSSEQASIQVTNLETSAVVFAYSVNKSSSARGKQSTAEACAKHLKDKIESRK